ncbi:hypothetical protein GCM10009085_14680 [Pseudomonas avellanae]|nr:hypothetical protein GCM10009085_14680 [Pseudomonas avellanae]
MAVLAKSRDACGGRAGVVTTVTAAATAATGQQVRLELPQSFPAERIKVNVAGGAAGKGGEGGKAGKGGASKGCIVYRADGGKAGRAGEAGLPGVAGPAGSLILQRL